MKQDKATQGVVCNRYVKFTRFFSAQCVIAVMAMSMLLLSCGGERKKHPIALSNDTLTGTIRISGAFALYPMVVKWAEEFRALHPNVKIDISGGGAGKGITDVLSDVADLGMVSRDIYPEEKLRGALPFAVAKDAVLPTVNTHNPAIASVNAKGITAQMARKIWSGQVSTWGEVTGTRQAIPLHVFTRSDACGAAETFAHWFGLKQENLKGTAVYGDPGVASVMQKDIVGIGMNNLAYVYDLKSREPYDGIQVFPIDLNGDGRITSDERFYDTVDRLMEAIQMGKFPSPPARDLYLIAHHKPERPELVAFLKFVLGDGQKFNVEAGFISLSEKVLEQQMALLK